MLLKFQRVAGYLLFGWSVYVAAQGPTVTVESGPIIGTTTSVSGASATVNKFLGIPYAAPPRRFDPPSRAQSWSTPLRTTAWRATCIQEFPYPKTAHDRAIQIYSNFGVPSPPQAESEDCLFINIYAPSTTAPSGGRAVMVWLFGGNLQFGNAGLPVSDGSYLAAYEDVIVVSPGYRTNVFGFLHSPELQSKNLGYLDQRFALEWVQRNIAKFGGDPSKVTIFGVSSGATSVKQLLAAPPNPPTFRAAIMESQANNGLPTSGAMTYDTIVKKTGCSSASSKINCLRGIDANLLRSIAENNTLLTPAYPDGVTSVSNVLDSISSGRWAKVPVMMGTLTEEGRSLAYIFLFNPDGTLSLGGLLPVDFWNKILPQAQILSGLAARILALYPVPNAYEKVAASITDGFFKCPTSTISQAMAARGYSVYRYLYAAAFPNIASVYPGGGVFHASEIPLVFGTYLQNGATSQQRQLSRYLMKKWADFAKNPSQGPDPGNWPRVGSSLLGRELNVIGRNGAVGGNLDFQRLYDVNCAIYQPVIPITGL